VPELKNTIRYVVSDIERSVLYSSRCYVQNASELRKEIGSPMHHHTLLSLFKISITCGQTH